MQIATNYEKGIPQYYTRFSELKSYVSDRTHICAKYEHDKKEVLKKIGNSGRSFSDS